MAKRLSWSSRAIADMNEIWEYTAERWGAEQALRYTTDIQERCRTAPAGVSRFQEVSVHGMTFVRIRSGSHYAYLCELESEFLVVRILHGRQDPSTQLRP